MYALDFSRTFPPERLSVADQRQLVSESQTSVSEPLSQSHPTKLSTSSSSSSSSGTGSYLHKMGMTSSAEKVGMFRSDGQLSRPQNEDRLFLCRQLRPEYVRQYRLPLNPDAFSGFGAHDEGFRESCRDVSAAVLELYKRTIPSFAAELQRIWLDQSRKRNISDDRYGKSLVKKDFGASEPVSLYDTPDETLQSLNIVTAVYDAGINLRHLGRVRAALPETETPLRTLVLIGREGPLPFSLYLYIFIFSFSWSFSFFSFFFPLFLFALCLALSQYLFDKVEWPISLLLF
jgi:hypothetical protein